MSSAGEPDAKRQTLEKEASMEDDPNAKEGLKTAEQMLYNYNVDDVNKQDNDRIWQTDVKYFTETKISTLAAMKMLKHSLAGVKKGKAGPGGQPVEVMGLLVGKPEGRTIIVMDALPLPVEGIEYKVEAAEEAQTYMIELMESLELRRSERFIGWYHSHPFEVSVQPNYFMSAMDISTQTSWQNSIPNWVAVVVDPMRSIAKQSPQLGVFRVFPPTHSPPQNMGPDGEMYSDDNALQKRWLSAHNRYYMLKVSYFMSGLGRQFLDVMARNNLWVRVLSNTSLVDEETRTGAIDRITKNVKGVEEYTKGTNNNKAAKEACQASSELAVEQCCGCAGVMVKNLLFNEVFNERLRQHHASAGTISSS